MQRERPHALCFGPFRLDLESEELRQETTRIRLRPKSFALLRYLAEHPRRLVTKDELLQAVWPDVVVSDAALAVCLNELRKALGDLARSPTYIETVPRRGYRFVGGIRSPAQAADAERSGTSPDASVLPVVGRAVELRRLHGWWDEAQRGARRLLFVTGEAGIGKSTVIDAFVDQAADRGAMWIGRGQCIEQHGGGEPYLSMLDALARVCRGPEGERMGAILRQYAPTWLVQMPWLLDAAEQTALERRALGSTGPRMLRELAEALEAASRERPLLLVLEDLQWSDGATLDLLAWLARRREPARLLLIGAYRPADVVEGHPLRGVAHELARQACCFELQLPQLTAAEVGQYLSAGLPIELVQGEPRELARAIHERTEGHPLFMVTLVDHLVQRGSRAAENGLAWVQGAIAEVEQQVPDGLRQLIDQQLRTLDDDERRAIEAASVAGIEFSAAAVAAGLGTSLTAADDRCASLARQERFLVRSGIHPGAGGAGAERYRFRHGLYRQVVYESISDGRRAELHELIGRQLEVSDEGAAGGRAAELAGHFGRGMDHGRAVRYRLEAADHALRRCAYHEAVKHLTTARTLLGTLPPDPERLRSELGVLAALGPALIATRGHAAPDVERVYVRARELCLTLDETPSLFPVLRGLSMLYLNRGELRRVRELAENRHDLARQHDDPIALVGAHDGLGAILYHLGEFAPARRHLEEGLALARRERQAAHLVPDGATDHAVACLGHLAWTLWCLGFPVQALERSREAIAVARELSHPFSLTQALYWGAQLLQFCRDAGGTQERAEAAMALATAHGFAQQQSQALLLRGWALAAQGRHGEGLAEMRQGLEGWEATGARLLRPYYLAMLAETLERAGQVDEGLGLLSEALAVARHTGERSLEAELLRLEGELRLASDAEQQDRADACFRQALDVARAQEARGLELRAAVSLARLSLRQGRAEEARRRLQAVYAWFTEGFEIRDLESARTVLQAPADDGSP